MPSLKSVSFACILATSALAAPSDRIQATTPENPQLEARIPDGRGPRVYPVPFPPPRCPQCPPLPCQYVQPILNPGFEAGGGSYSSWTTNDSSVLSISSLISELNIRNPGTHSLQLTLSSTHQSAQLSQNLTVCPNVPYTFGIGVYFDQTVTASIASLCNLNVQIGALSSVISFANSTFFNPAPSAGKFVDITFPYTAQNMTTVPLSVGVQCVGLTGTAYDFFLDNVELMLVTPPPPPPPSP